MEVQTENTGKEVNGTIHGDLLATINNRTSSLGLKLSRGRFGSGLGKLRLARNWKRFDLTDAH